MPAPKRPWTRGGALGGIAAVLVALACAAPAPTDAGEEEDARPPIIQSSGGADAAAPPTFTPYSVLPAIRNRGEVAAALGRAYAALPAEAGGGRTADVWFFIEDGPRARDVRLNRPTGNRALDRALIAMADEVEFSPALNRDQERALWVSLPVSFDVGDGWAGLESRGGDSLEGRVITTPVPPAQPADTETGAVVGVVRDAVSGRPMPDVQVYVPGTGRGTLSDPDGRFRIDHVPVGAREVVAHLVGYDDVRARVSVAALETHDLDVGLQQTVIELDPLTVRPGSAPGG